MAIPDSGSPYVYRQLDASSKPNLLVDMKDALVASGWTLAQTNGAYVALTFTGLPSNAQTCTFDGVTYTFKTVLVQANPREVLIGIDAAACASNLADAINEEAGTKGTSYSNSTTAHPTCTASDSGAVCTVSGANGMTASEALSNATLDRTTFLNGGYRLNSARCPSGLQMRLILDDDGASATMIRLRVGTADEAVILTNPYYLGTAAGRLLEFVGCKHQVFTFLLGAPIQIGANFMCGTPALKDKNAPPKIASISDSSGLFQIETLTAHGMVTGEHVYIAGATRDSGASSSAINGDWPITVVDSTHYTLDGSTYAAETYDANTGLSGSTSSVSRAFWSAGGTTATIYGGNFRNTLGYNPGTVAELQLYHGVCLNQYSYSQSYAGAGQVLRLKRAVDDLNASIEDLGGMVDLIEAQIAWPISSAVAQVRTVGSLWNAFVLTAAYGCDKVKHNWQGFNWINYTNNSSYARGSLWLITTAVT